MLPVWVIFIAAALRILGGIAYLRATLDGRAKPNPLSWLLWGVTPLIALFAELSAGVGPAVFVTMALAASPLMVFVATMYKNPRSFKFDRLNVYSGLFAISGIVLWQLTDDPHLAIMVAILADIASSMPTIKKTIHRPHTEYAPTYAISAFSMILTLLTIQTWNFATFAFPIYVLVMNSFMVSLIVLRKKPRPKTRRRSTASRRRRTQPRYS